MLQCCDERVRASARELSATSDFQVGTHQARVLSSLEARSTSGRVFHEAAAAEKGTLAGLREGWLAASPRHEVCITGCDTAMAVWAHCPYMQLSSSPFSFQPRHRHRLKMGIG